MPRRPRPHPATFTHAWPHEPITTDGPAEVARLLANNLKAAMGGRSGRAVGDACGVDFTTVNAILNGTTWPDLRTIALLEAGLGAPLWPRTASPEPPTLSR